MKVQFWSPLHGQGRTTSNLFSNAVMGVLKYNLKTLLTQTHFKNNNFEAPLIGKAINKEYERLYYDGIGMDALIRALKAAPLTEEEFRNCTISLMKEKLSLLSGTKQVSEELFLKDMEGSIINLLRNAEKYFDVVFVDSNSGDNKLARKISEECDVICVNMAQNESMFDLYFESDMKFDPKKIVYIISAYDSNSKYTVRNLKKKYPQIRDSTIAYIPYDIGFSDALNESELISFMTKNSNADANNKHKEFMDAVDEVARKIIQIGGLERKKNGLFG